MRGRKYTEQRQEIDAMSGTNGDGNGNGADGGAPRMSIPEALAALGSPHTPLDRHIRFTCEQFADALSAFSAINRRCDLLEGEIARLTAEVAALKAQRDGPSEDQVTLQ